MINSILLFYRDKCEYSLKFKNFLKKKTKKIFLVKNVKNHKNKSISKILKKNYSLILSFKSYYILPEKLINKADIAAINFHPGPPKYRGIGCLNYALYENSKVYGITTHMMNKKIDNGKIIDVKKFKIKKSETVDTLLKKTNEEMLDRAKYIINNLIKNKYFLKNKIIKNQNFKWSKTIKNRNELDKFYQIKLLDSNKEIKKKIRATNSKLFKPYLRIKGFLFEYNEKYI